MLNTFENSDKSERRRRDRERQLELLAEASSSRDVVPSFLDEDMIHLVRSGRNLGAAAGDVDVDVDAVSLSSRSVGGGGERDSVVNIFPDGGGGFGGCSLSSARSSKRGHHHHRQQTRSLSRESRGGGGGGGGSLASSSRHLSPSPPPRDNGGGNDNDNDKDKSDSNLYDYGICDAASSGGGYSVGGNSTDLEDVSPPDESRKSCRRSIKSEFSPESEEEEGEELSTRFTEDDDVAPSDSGGGRMRSWTGKKAERKSEWVPKSRLDEGMHAPPLGLAESATRFLWEEEDDDRHGRGSVPMRGFDGEMLENDDNDGIHVVGRGRGMGDEERVGLKRAINRLYGEERGRGEDARRVRNGDGGGGGGRGVLQGGNLLRDLLPSFGPKRDAGDTHRQVPDFSVGSSSRRGRSPGPRDPYSPGIHRCGGGGGGKNNRSSTRKIGGPGARRGSNNNNTGAGFKHIAIVGSRRSSNDSAGGGGTMMGGFNIAPRRFHDSLKSQEMDEVDLRRSMGHGGGGSGRGNYYGGRRKSSMGAGGSALNVAPYEYDGTYGFASRGGQSSSASRLERCLGVFKPCWNDCFLDRCLFNNPRALRGGLCVVCLILAAGLAIGYVERGQQQGEGASVRIGGPGGGSVTPGRPHEDDIDLARIEDVKKRIIDAGVTSPTALADPAEGESPTPQMLAARWIALADPAELKADDEFLLQRYGLAVLFLGTDGEHWMKKNGWMSEGGVCQWHGVRCRPRPGRPPDEHKFDGNGEVIELVLEKNGLSGGLPPEVFTALGADLTTLDLNSNGLFGSLPDELGVATRIVTLDLGSNYLTGTVPSAALRRLDTLAELDLSDNSLNGTVPASDLAKRSSAVEAVDSTLVALSLFGNEFTGPVPTELGKLTLLRSLYLDSNLLTGTVSSYLGELKHVTDLRMRDNDLTGPLPSELSSLSMLEVLYMDSNHLSGTLHPSFASLLRLEQLNLYDNALSGILPASWGTELMNLKHLYLDGNALTGSIPSQWGALVEVRHLFLNDNRLSGSLPTEMSELENIIKLRLQGNHLTGVVPPEFGNFSVLTHLNLELNRFGGTVPDELSQLVELESLTVQGNDITGTMPPGVCRLREGGRLKELKASCLGQNARIKCHCCTSCY